MESREAEIRAECAAEVNILKEKQQELLDKARKDRKAEEEVAKREAKEEKKRQKEEAEEEKKKTEETIKRAERKAKDAKEEVKGLKVREERGTIWKGSIGGCIEVWLERSTYLENIL